MGEAEIARIISDPLSYPRGLGAAENTLALGSSVNRGNPILESGVKGRCTNNPGRRATRKVGTSPPPMTTTYHKK